MRVAMSPVRFVSQLNDEREDGRRTGDVEGVEPG